MTDHIVAFEIEARLLRWNEGSAAGRTITLELDPDAGEHHPFKGYVSGNRNGQRFRLVFAPIDDDETSAIPATVAEPEPPAAAEAPARSPNKSEQAKVAYQLKDDMQKAVTRASLLCKDPAFQEWLRDKQGRGRNWGSLDREEVTVTGLRTELGVSSRSQIAEREWAYRNFLELESAFKTERDYAEHLQR